MLRVGLDFDGVVIHHKPRFTYDLNYKLFKNCKKVLDRLSKKDIVFILNTARTGIRRWLAFLYIKVYKLPIRLNLTGKKPVADVYIDDKNLWTKPINWLEIEKELLKKKEEKCTTLKRD